MRTKDTLLFIPRVLRLVFWIVFSNEKTLRNPPQWVKSFTKFR